MGFYFTARASRLKWGNCQNTGRRRLSWAWTRTHNLTGDHRVSKKRHLANGIGTKCGGEGVVLPVQYRCTPGEGGLQVALLAYDVTRGPRRGVALVWPWCGLGVALVWPWCGFGVALVWLWGGFGWLCAAFCLLPSALL